MRSTFAKLGALRGGAALTEGVEHGVPPSASLPSYVVFLRFTKRGLIKHEGHESAQDMWHWSGLRDVFNMWETLT